MKSGWHHCKKILCIRPDNMGDLLMSSPAIRALKNTFGCRITVLTSTVAGAIASFIPEIDEVLTFDLPWVKNEAVFNSTAFNLLIEKLRDENFDAAVIFTVYSQNPLPSAIISFMAGIPLRLGYCRENPYALLTHWIPEQEPYTFIRHQVQRDLDLVANVDAYTPHEQLSLSVSENRWDEVGKKLADAGVDVSKPWLIFHPGASEEKRMFPENDWITLAGEATGYLGHQVLITGGMNERKMGERLAAQCGRNAFSIAGMFSLEEFILLIKRSPLVISVNTGTIHIAAATGTPIIVLYALTNPQHTPWRAVGKIFPFHIQPELQSKSEVIRYVNAIMSEEEAGVDLYSVVTAASNLLTGIYDPRYLIPDLVGIPVRNEQVL